jgi:hypothetical protein
MCVESFKAKAHQFFLCFLQQKNIVSIPSTEKQIKKVEWFSFFFSDNANNYLPFQDTHFS